MNRTVFIITLLAFVPAVLAMLPITGLHYGAPSVHGTGGELKDLGAEPGL